VAIGWNNQLKIKTGGTPKRAARFFYVDVD
jgi:hypothetical protein